MNLITRMASDGDASLFRGVFVLTMPTFRMDLLPTVALNTTNDVSDLHRHLRRGAVRVKSLSTRSLDHAVRARRLRKVAENTEMFVAFSATFWTPYCPDIYSVPFSVFPQPRCVSFGSTFMNACTA